MKRYAGKARQEKVARKGKRERERQEREAMKLHGKGYAGKE